MRSRARCCSPTIARPETSQKEQIRSCPPYREAIIGFAGDVAEHETVLSQVIGDRQHALTQHFVIGRQEAEDRGQQRGGIEGICVVVLAEDAAADAVLEDVSADLLCGCTPLGLQTRVPADLRQL